MITQLNSGLTENVSAHSFYILHNTCSKVLECSIIIIQACVLLLLHNVVQSSIQHYYNYVTQEQQELYGPMEHIPFAQPHNYMLHASELLICFVYVGREGSRSAVVVICSYCVYLFIAYSRHFVVIILTILANID